MMDWALHPVLQAVGWGLLHFLWQGMLLALLLKGLFTLFRFSASARYWLSMATLVLMLAMFLATSAMNWEPANNLAMAFPELPESSNVDDSSPVVGAVDEIVATVKTPAPQSNSFVNVLQYSLPNTIAWLAVGWGLGLIVFMLKLAGGWVYLRTIIRQSVPSEQVWQKLVAQLSKRISLKANVRLCESEHIQSVFTAGVWRPVIMIPIGYLTGLSSQHVEAILLHELAHIRRYDYFLNLVQSFVESLFYFHPAVWWVSHQVRVAREECCDDLAVAAVGDQLSYAKALAHAQPSTTVPLAASWKGGSLLDRVRRLLGPKKQRTSRLAVFASITCLILLFAGVIQTPILQASAPIESFFNFNNSFPEALDPPDISIASIQLNQKQVVPTLEPEELAKSLDNKIAPPVIEPSNHNDSSTGVFCNDDEHYAMPGFVHPKPRTINDPNLGTSCFNFDIPTTGNVGTSVTFSLVESEVLNVEPVKLVWDNLVWRLTFETLNGYSLNSQGTDVVSVSSSGFVELAIREWFTTRKVRWQDNGQGQMEKLYFVNNRPAQWTAAAEKWLEKQIKWLVNQGIRAHQFVSAQYEHAGAQGVLDLIENLKLPRVKWLYLKKLRPYLSEDEQNTVVLPTLEAVANELISIGNAYKIPEIIEEYFNTATFDLLLEASLRIESAYYKSLALQSIIEQATIPQHVTSAVNQIHTIQSDYYRAVTLINAYRKSMDNDALLDAYQASAESIESSFYRYEVYEEAFKRISLSSDQWASWIVGASSIPEDYYTSEVLISSMRYAPRNGTTFGAVINAVGQISSDYYQQEVFSELFNKFQLSEARWLIAFDGIARMDSDYYKASLLMKSVEYLLGKSDAILGLIKVASMLDENSYSYSVFDHLTDVISLSEVEAIAFIRAIESISVGYRHTLIRQFIVNTTITPRIQDAMKNLLDYQI
jgi:beta-lactamase regulating signal transducer with metallopeptidase domain